MVKMKTWEILMCFQDVRKLEHVDCAFSNASPCEWCHKDNACERIRVLEK